MTALVLLHPAMSGIEAHEWCRRHGSELHVEHRQGKVHLIVTAQPHPAPASPSFSCSGCGWAGADPNLIPGPTGPVGVCPKCDATHPILLRSVT